MADDDPFADGAFVSRLQKLLPMLASEQPGEADAARRKLLEHLGSHRLSLTDVAQRLQPGAAGGAGRASFLQGAREMSMERQLQVARVSRQEAEANTQRALMRIAELQQSLNGAAFEAARALQGQARVRLLAGVGWLLAGIVAAISISEHLHMQGVAQGRAEVAANQSLLGAPALEGGEASLRLSPGERFGTVLVQDLAVRLSPSEDAGVRAFLNRGMRVVVVQQVRVGVQAWLLIRSVTGSGWVRGSDVLR